MTGVDLAGDTISIVKWDRKVEVAPNWTTVFLKHVAKTMIEDKQQHTAIVNIAEMIYGS